MTTKRTPRRRQLDRYRGFLCWCAARASDFWDWIEKRKIIPHTVSLGVFYGTIQVTEWGMAFVAENDNGLMTGVEMAAVIAAVTAPFSLLQIAVIKFQFESFLNWKPPEAKP